MTHTEQAKYIGATGIVSYDGMEFSVKVIDVRQSWGDTQVEVVPAPQGAVFHGSAWKSAHSVRFDNKS